MVQVARTVKEMATHLTQWIMNVYIGSCIEQASNNVFSCGLSCEGGYLSTGAENGLKNSRRFKPPTVMWTHPQLPSV